MGYDIGNIGQTATTTAALMGSLLTTTATQKPSCTITAAWANIGGVAMTTAGGYYFIGSTWQTVGTQTTTTAPSKKNFMNPAASTGAVTVTANGAIGSGTQTPRITVGVAMTGGTGFWMATTPDMGLTLPEGGAVGGYADFSSRGPTASGLMNWNVEFYES